MIEFSLVLSSNNLHPVPRRISDLLTTEASEAARRGMRRFSQTPASARSGDSEGSAGGRTAEPPGDDSNSKNIKDGTKNSDSSMGDLD